MTDEEVKQEFPRCHILGETLWRGNDVFPKNNQQIVVYGPIGFEMMLYHDNDKKLQWHNVIRWVDLYEMMGLLNRCVSALTNTLEWVGEIGRDENSYGAMVAMAKSAMSEAKNILAGREATDFGESA